MGWGRAYDKRAVGNRYYTSGSALRVNEACPRSLHNYMRHSKIFQEVKWQPPANGLENHSISENLTRFLQKMQHQQGISGIERIVLLKDEASELMILSFNMNVFKNFCPTN